MTSLSSLAFLAVSASESASSLGRFKVGATEALGPAEVEGPGIAAAPLLPATGSSELCLGVTVAKGGGTDGSSSMASAGLGTNSVALGLREAELGLTEAMAVAGRTPVAEVRTCCVGRMVAV